MLDIENSPPSPLSHHHRLYEKPLGRKSSRPLSDHKSRKRDFVTASAKDLARLLISEEREANDLHHLLSRTTEQLRAETQRANDLERRLRDFAVRLKTANDARISAQQEVSRVSEELRLYKLQLENAQKEIFRAQDILKTVDAQRHEAEEAAAKARSIARRLKEERVVMMAREEGRKLGVQEGLERGKDLGYREGKAHGYSQGRSNAERAMERYFLQESEADGPTQDYSMYTRPASTSSSSHSIPQRMTTAPTSPAEIHPVLVHNSGRSPRHPEVAIPPEGWIPSLDEDHMIRLPPPHEMSRPPPSRTPSPPMEDPAVMIPVPSSPGYEPVTPGRPRHRRRRSSLSSQSSTTISQLDLVSAPEPSVTRNLHRRVSGVLSVIPESNSSRASPNVVLNASLRRGTPMPEPHRTLDEPSSSPAPLMTMPMSTLTVPSAAELEERLRDDYYRQPRDSSSESSGSVRSPTLSRKNSRPRSFSSASTVPDINIEPPTRPPSNGSKASAEAPQQSEFLSPADANRPIPLPSPSRSEPAPPPPSSGPTPIILSSDQLPPGFVPSPNAAGTTYTASGVPLPPSSALSALPLPSMPGGLAPDGNEPAVIPPRSMMTRRYDSSSDDNVSTTSSSSMGSLTTPPSRRRVLRSEVGATPYSAAGVPLPPSTIGVTPYSTSGVPLPPSTVGTKTRSLAPGTPARSVSKQSLRG